MSSHDEMNPRESQLLTMAVLCLCLVLWRDEVSRGRCLDHALQDHGPRFSYDPSVYLLRREVASRKTTPSDQARTDMVSCRPSEMRQYKGLMHVYIQ